MIRSLREQLTDRGFRIILFIALASFIFASVVPVFYTLFSRNPQEGVFATINGIEFTTSEFLNKVQNEQRRRDMFRQQFGKEANRFLAMMGMAGSVEDYVFDRVKFDKVIDSVARDISLEISPEYIVEKLQDKNFLESEFNLGSFVDSLGRVDTDRLAAALRQSGVSIADLEREAENSLRRSFVQKFITAAAYTPEYAVRQRYIQEYVARKYTIAQFDYDYYLKQARSEKPTDEALRNFFDKENRLSKRYLVPEKRSGYYYQLDPYSYGIDVTDKEIETKYNKTKKNYLVTNETLNIRKKEFPFTKENKEDVLKEAQNYLAGLEALKPISTAKPEAFERGKVDDKKLARAAFALKEDGQISDVVEGKKSFIVLQRVSRDVAQYKSLAEVKDDIKDVLLTDKFKRRFPQDVRRALNENRIAAFIQDKGAVKNIMNDQAKSESKINAKLFMLAQDKYGYIFDGGQGYLVQVTDIQKPHVAQLEDIKDRVLQDYYEYKAGQKLKAQVEALYEKLSSSTTAELAQEPGVSIVHTDFIKPQDKDAVKKLRDKGINTQEMFELTLPGSLYKEINKDQAAVIRLDERGEIDEKAFESEKSQIKASLDRETERAFQSAFVADLLKNAKIIKYTVGTSRKHR